MIEPDPPYPPIVTTHDVAVLVHRAWGDLCAEPMAQLLTLVVMVDGGPGCSAHVTVRLHLGDAFYNKPITPAMCQVDDPLGHVRRLLVVMAENLNSAAALAVMPSPAGVQ